jgi:hypothetical protein
VDDHLVVLSGDEHDELEEVAARSGPMTSPSVRVVAEVVDDENNVLRN